MQSPTDSALKSSRADAIERDGLIRGARETMAREILRLPVCVVVSGFLVAYVSITAAALWLGAVLAVELLSGVLRRRVARGARHLRTPYVASVGLLSVLWVVHAVLLWFTGEEVARIATLIDLFTVALYGALGGHKDWRMLAAMLPPPLIALLVLLTHLLWTTQPVAIAVFASLATLGACATIAANGIAMHRSDRALLAANIALDEERHALESRVGERTAELTAALARAGVAAAAKSDFLAAASHELKTPLNAIIGYAELLGEDLRTVATPDPVDAERIADAGRNLLGMVSAILDYAQMDSSAVAPRNTPADLEAVLEDVRRTAARLAHANNVTIEIGLERGVGEIITDDRRLRQCLTELVTNACKFAPGAPVRISVRTAKHDRSVVHIEIADSGPGLPEHLAADPFALFVQGQSGETRGHGGLGLGLALSKKIAELLGGTLRVTNPPGGGAVFTLAIPRTPPVMRQRAA